MFCWVLEVWQPCWCLCQRFSITCVSLHAIHCLLHSGTELGVKRNNEKKVSATDNYLNEEEGESNISVSTLGLIQTAD